MAVLMSAQLDATRGELRFEPAILRVRAFSDGHVVTDSNRALLVWEPGRLVPMYAVPEQDLRFGVSRSTTQAPPIEGRPPVGPRSFASHSCPGESLDVGTASGVLPAAGFRPDDVELAHVVVLDFNAFDAWLVEDEPRVSHPHDPFKRISVHACSRRVEVAVGGTQIASSDRTLLLLETHLPARYYFPPEHVRLDLLVASDHRTACAYKGHAAYVSLPGVEENIGWRYDEPLDDALRVKGHVAFWNERVDLVIDGEPQERPESPWTAPGTANGR